MCDIVHPRKTEKSSGKYSAPTSNALACCKQIITMQPGTIMPETYLASMLYYIYEQRGKQQQHREQRADKQFANS